MKVPLLLSEIYEKKYMCQPFATIYFDDSLD